MSGNKFYDVTITDHGRYRVRVVAGYPDEAERIAREILLDECTNGCPEVTIEERKLEAVVADDAGETGEAKLFRTAATYSIDFEMTVPANDRQEAERHARRLYHANAGPFEFEISADRVTSFDAWEVQS